MSASEKLRALEKPDTGVRWSRLAAVYPQIVAVVEAAEQTEEHPNLSGGTNRICKICGYDINWKEGPNRGPNGHGSDCALAALDDALVTAES